MARRMKQRRKQNQVKIHKSRKELRKEQRKLKKEKKNEFFQRRKNKSEKSVVENAEHEVQMKSNADMSVCKSKKKKVQKNYSERERHQKLQVDMKNQRMKQLKEANQQEDKVIRKLEKQLKLNKKKLKSVPKSFTADGLDYLLEVCEPSDMQNATVMDITLHDSGSQFTEDLALIKGNTQKDSTRRRQNNIIVSNSDNDSDAREGADSDETETEEFGEVMNFEDSDNSGSDTIQVEQNSQMSSESELDRRINKHVLKINTKNLNNKAFSDDSDATVEHLISEERNLKRKRNEVYACQVSDTEKREVSKQLLEHKRKFQKCKLTDKEKCGELEESHNMDDESRNIKLTRTEKQKHESAIIRFKNDVDVDDVCEKDSGDIVEEEKESGDVNSYWEDIYGRTRDKQGNVIKANTERYVPPHVRGNTVDEDSKKQQQLKRLRRQMKGLLNRLAENNMNTIALQMEELYMSHSRNNMNESLTDLLFESLVSQVITPERLIMEHAMLVAVLHANVGTEVGAHTLQVFVRKFDKHYRLKEEVENKQLDNIILMLSHLYNFKMFSAVLMYDILGKLAKRFEEKEVELILLILRSVGFSLRKDDPLALKELILKLQQMAGEAANCKNSTRVKFMLEILLAIKNNNMAKIPNYDPTHSEHLKKLMKGILRKGNYITELKISLDDLLNADERGRWWIVGSAWTGSNPGKTGKQEPDNCTKLQQSNAYSQKLLDLARKHRMNTDVRRNIFCILMTAEDYLDAFEKLLHLGLKNQQEREIVHVVINCCLQEKQFNPYYCHLSQKFCDFDRKFQITIQCALWDRFKEFQNMPSFQVTNLAKFLVHLVIEKGLPLSVLKVIHFAEVDQITVRFLRQVLLGILLNDSEEAFQQAFQRVAVSSKLHLFQEGIRLFIHHFLLRNMKSVPQEDMEMLQQRAKMADKILSSAESKVKF